MQSLTYGVFALNSDRRKKYTPEQLSDLKELYPTHSNEKLAELKGMTKAALQGLAQVYDWRKDEKYIVEKNRASAKSRKKLCVQRLHGWCESANQEVKKRPAIAKTRCGDKIRTKIIFKRTYPTCHKCRQKK
jgi:hypothetical protein